MTSIIVLPLWAIAIIVLSVVAAMLSMPPVVIWAMERGLDRRTREWRALVERSAVVAESVDTIHEAQHGRISDLAARLGSRIDEHEGRLAALEAARNFVPRP